jgi:hypothetical protein
MTEVVEWHQHRLRSKWARESLKNATIYGSSKTEKGSRLNQTEPLKDINVLHFFNKSIKYMNKLAVERGDVYRYDWSIR